jgi:hypothetical protein
MHEAYYGPAASAVHAVNRLLGLSATGREQDWEIEFANGARAGEMLDLLKSPDLDLDVRSALALVALHSMDQGARPDMIKLVVATREIFSAFPCVRNRMRSYWQHHVAGEVVAAALA